jgi:hypothetical protein
VWKSFLPVLLRGLLSWSSSLLRRKSSTMPSVNTQPETVPKALRLKLKLPGVSVEVQIHPEDLTLESLHSWKQECSSLGNLLEYVMNDPSGSPLEGDRQTASVLKPEESSSANLFGG